MLLQGFVLVPSDLTGGLLVALARHGLVFAVFLESISAFYGLFSAIFSGPLAFPTLPFGGCLLLSTTLDLI